MTIFCKWCIFCLSCRRDPSRQVGRRRGKSGRIREKLSGKRTAASTNPGKFQAFGLDTDGETPRLPQGIISQVKRQEEGDWINVAFLLFILCRGVPRQDVSTRLKEQQEASPFLSKEESLGLLSKRVGLMDTENAFKIGPYIRAIEEQGKKVIKCNLGEPDFPVPQFVKEEVKRQIDLDNTYYCDPQGILTLRVAIAKQRKE